MGEWPTSPQIRIIFAAVLILASTHAGEAQQTLRLAKVGVLSPALNRNPIDEAFEQSLRGLGWARGQNVAIEHRYSAGRPEVFPLLAAELVGLGVDVWTCPGLIDTWVKVPVLRVRAAARTLGD
jgi:hypothetical protein